MIMEGYQAIKLVFNIVIEINIHFMIDYIKPGIN